MRAKHVIAETLGALLEDRQQKREAALKETEALERAIVGFARTLGLDGEVSMDRVCEALVSRAQKRKKDKFWVQEAECNGFSRLFKIMDEYEKFKAFSAQALIDQIAEARDEFLEKSAAAAELDEDDRQFELRKQKRAERKRVREVA